ncbi:glycosyltransferase family 39 protein [Caulobacter sp. SL161]|uniref:ArnT family glycosyltransferase n=1 Tax=Caulobacter sp. SL161 TaxID=2995156 RepID=UPI0022767B8F|nr:glycosyltransferase family 39 protein [Caulobacter sp. SL161]MCY1646266.1 glycosyltransferase family 39 protein [Caulobacter sp. SL161]
MQTAPDASSPSIESRAWRLTLLMIGGLTIVRLAALFLTPLELYPDEAQYWLWSRELAFGYFSKPPMIAWLIWATTQIGDSEAWVRLSAPFLHGATALVIHRIARRLYGGWAGLAAAAIYSLMPGVVLSSGLIATDAPLLFFLSLTVWAYVSLPDASARRRYALAAGMGAALGLAFLSKYAAVYALGSVALHFAISSEARRRWSPALVGLFIVAFALVLAPNLLWNAANQFSTVKHTAANANWNAHQLFNVRELIEFVGSQFGVFGPVPFAVLIGGAIWLGVKRKLQSPDLLLLCFALPPLIVVAGEAFVSRANANWAGAAFVSGSVIVAGWLMRWNARRWLIGGLVLQAAFAAFFVACMVNPKVADATGLSNGFKRVRGWDQTVEAVIARVREEQALRGPLSAVAMDDRFVYNAAAYYGRDYFGQPGAPPLRMWVHEAYPQNQAETETPLDADYGRRALIVSLEGGYRPEIEQDFKAVSGLQIARVRLDKTRSRRVDLFIAEGFAPLPRDPITGLPPKPKTPAR